MSEGPPFIIGVDVGLESQTVANTSVSRVGVVPVTIGDVRDLRFYTPAEQPKPIIDTTTVGLCVSNSFISTGGWPCFCIIHASTGPRATAPATPVAQATVV